MCKLVVFFNNSNWFIVDFGISASSTQKFMFSEAPPTTITPSAINAGIFPLVYKWRASNHQEELKSAKTEFIKEDREKVRDPERCRMKHTEDTEEQAGLCLFFINNAEGYNASSRFRFVVIGYSFNNIYVR